MQRVAIVSSALALSVLGLVAGAVRLSADEKGAGAKDSNITFAAYSRDDKDTQHIFYRTKDGHLMELWAKHGDTKGWNSRNLTANAKAPPAAGSPTCYFLDKNNTQHVIYRGENGQLHELYLMDKQDNWAHRNLTEATGAPSADSNPAGYVMDSDNTQHIVYRSNEGDLIELYHVMTKETPGWKMRNLTADAKAPRAVGNPEGYFQKSNKSQHVFYRDKDGQVHELYLGDRQDRWAHSNLTTEAKAPKAASDLAGYLMDSNKTQHVVYRTEDGDLIELYHAPDGAQKGWHSKNLTAEAKAPKAEGAPAGFFTNETKTQHIYYRDKEGQIQEVYLKDKQERWAHNNLSALTKAPKAATDPSAYFLDKNDTQHVIFITTDGQVCELYHLPKGDNQGWHSNNLSTAAKLP